MQVKDLLLKLKKFGLDITALQNKDTDLQSQITELKKQVGNLDVTEAIQTEITKALEEFTTTVDSKDEAIKAALQQEIAQAVEQINATLEGKADKVHTHEANDIVESEEKQFVSAAKKSQYDENTVYTNEMQTVTALGGIAAGTSFDNMPVNEVLTKLLYPYIAPSISASGTPNGGTFEKGDNKTITSVKVSVTKKSEKITKVEVFNGGESLGAKEGTEVQNGGSFTFDVNVEVPSTNVLLTAKVTDAANKTYSANTGGFNYVYPYYFGVVNADVNSLDEATVKGMVKKIEGKGNKTYTYNCNNQRMVIAYPKAHGNLKSIIDPNGFDNFNSFTKSEISITGLDGSAQTYNVYVNGASTVTNFAMKFNY